MSFLNEDPVSLLPAELQDYPEWVDRRTEIMNALKKDAEGLPMSTAQHMLMERLATFYVLLRKREAEPGSKLSFQDIRQNQQQWLAMTTEFNRQLTIGEDERRAKLKENFQKVVVAAVNRVKDDQIRRDLLKSITEGFREVGL